MRKSELLILLTVLTCGIGLTSHHVAAGQTSPNQQNVTSSVHLHKNQYQFGHTILTVKKAKPVFRHLSSYQVNLILHQLRAQTLHDIKVERAQHVSTDIHLNPKLNRLAALRAKQVAKHFSHYNHDHKPMTTVDARKVRLPSGFQGSENLASSSLGNCTVIADPKVYHNRNGKDLANMSNNAMMNYDAFEENGHRKNILSGDNTLVGIGAAYSSRKHTFYLAEDFGNEDPRSSEDVNKLHLHFHLKQPQRVTWKSLWTAVQKKVRTAVRLVESKI